MSESPLSKALRKFEETEANLSKLIRLCEKAESLIPSGIVFGDNPEYEDICRSMDLIAGQIPKIDGWKPDFGLMDLNEIAQARFDALEVGEPECQISVEGAIYAPSRALREYRFRFNQKRRELVRGRVEELEGLIDHLLVTLADDIGDDKKPNEPVESEKWDTLRQHVAEIDTLLGSSVNRPARWTDLRRHIGFAQFCDFIDIQEHDWPNVKTSLRSHLYGEDEPIPVNVDDLGEIVAGKPTGPVATRLAWSNLTADEFERLLYALIGGAEGYENPEWLMNTSAPDQGRDLSVIRVIKDLLSGTRRDRVMIQCKHWLGRSVSVSDVATLKEQVRL